MADGSTWIRIAYLIGVAIGVFSVDGRAATRIGLALAWPLGPLAFVVTIGGLILVAAIAFPVFGVVLAAAAATAAWISLH